MLKQFMILNFNKLNWNKSVVNIETVFLLKIKYKGFKLIETI